MHRIRIKASVVKYSLFFTVFYLLVVMNLELQAFTNALWNRITTSSSICEPNSCLELPNNVYFLDESGFPNILCGSKLFIRECFEPLYQEIKSSHDKQRPPIISGTPGIGKTSFRNYVIYRLLYDMYLSNEYFPIIIDQTQYRYGDDSIVEWGFFQLK